MFKTLGLYRQLQFSHFLVTLLTAFVLALCVLLGYFWYASTGQFAAWAADEALGNADLIGTKQGDQTLGPESAQRYVNQMSWPFLEAKRRDLKGDDIPEWYASSWFVILSPNGNVLASNQVNGLTPGKRFGELHAPAFQASWLQFKKPVKYDHPEPLLHSAHANDLHIGFAPIINGDDVLLGWVYRRFENESVLQFLRGIANTVLYGFLGAAVVAILTSSLIGNRFAKTIAARLGRLNQLSQAYATGDFTQRYQAPPKDEIGKLGEQFNRMAAQIANQMLELRTLAQKNTQLLEESRGLAILEERNRLARDLHDAVKQQLFGLNLNISAIKQLLRTDPERALVQLEHANRLTSQALQEMDVILKQLRPVSLEREGLILALEEMLHDWATQNNGQFEMRVDGDVPLPPTFEQCLYRIAQEGLHNVSKHAQANQVRLKLQLHPHEVRLHLSDDGHGFDVHQHLGHSLGLKNMTERAQALGGALLVESGTQGTMLSVSLPLGTT